MTEISRYTQYLPSVLWSKERDASQFLGRMLQIFEKLLTGVASDTTGLGAEIAIVQASDRQIQAVNATDLHSIDPGDRLMLQGLTPQGSRTELICVKTIQGATINLVSPLKASYTNGLIRLTDKGAINSTIDRIPDLFNPWRAPADFLPWLASWIALPLKADWNEYQCRKFISEMVSIYQKRGLKEGLLIYLDLYVATKSRPRIAIDDGEAILRATMASDGTMHLHPVTYSYAISLAQTEQRPALSRAVLLHPTAIAVDREGHYIVADAGNQETEQQWQPALWKISGTGEIRYRTDAATDAATGSATGIPLPQPLYQGSALTNPVAVVVDQSGQYYVLTVGSTSGLTSQRAAIHCFSPPDYSLETLVSQTTNPILPAIHPVDMVLETLSETSRRFVILDRGTHFSQSNTRLVIVTATKNSDSDPSLAIEPPIEFPDIIEPTALAIDATGQLIIADAREPLSSSEPFRAADLFRVNLADRSVTSLLGMLDLQHNPLIFPTGLVFEHPDSLLVCDVGVHRLATGSAGERHRAEPAGLYRVDLSQTPPQITRITPERRLVHPTKMAIDRQHLVITDRGATYDLFGDALNAQEWRTKPNTFGVVVSFSKERPTTTPDRNRILFEISQLLNEQKPGHTSYWLKF